MQTFSPLLLGLQVANSLCAALAQAASALPIILALTLLLTRKGKTKLCLFGAKEILRLNLILALVGPLYVGGDFLIVVTKLKALGNNWQLPSIWSKALLPYTISSLLWILGALTALISSKILARNLKLASLESLSFKELRGLLGLTLILFCLFFAAWLSLIFPFAGLPQGLSWADAWLAVLGQTEHRIFFSLLPASLIVLLILPHRFKDNFKASDQILAARWMAACGLFGGLPKILSSWGTILGYLLRHDVPYMIWVKLIENTLLTLTLLILALLAFKKEFKFRSIWFKISLGCFVLSLLVTTILLLKNPL